MKCIAVLLSVVATLFVLVSCEKEAPKTTPTSDNTAVIRIGVLADTSGFMSGHGASVEMGAALAAEMLNESGGILGKKVELVVLDAKSDPTITAERTRELIQKDKVQLLIGTGTSAATLAAIGPATMGSVPFIYALDGECKTCRPGSPDQANPFVFGSGFTERMVVGPLVKELIEQSGKPPAEFRAYLIGGDYVYPRTTNAYARQVIESAGATVVGDDYSDTSTSDYVPLIRKILEAKPDLLIVTNPGSSGVTFMRQSVPFGLTNKMVVSGFATFDQEAIDAMGNASEGVMCINRYSNTLANNENQEFLKRFRKRYPDRPLLPGPTAAAGGFGAVVVAAAAFERAATTDATAFSKAMKGLEMDLPQGRVRVNPQNHIFDQPIYLMRIHDQRYEVVRSLGLMQHPGFEGCSVR